MLLRWLLGELYLQSWKWQEPHPSTDQDQAVCEWKSLYERRGHTIDSANVELFVRLEQTKHCFGWRHIATMFTV